VNPVATVLVILLALVAVGSLALLAVVVRISLRRSSAPTVAGDAVAGAVREAATELVTALVVGDPQSEVDAATGRLAGLLDIDPTTLRRAAARARRT
jgi:hypothetical protein